MQEQLASNASKEENRLISEKLMELNNKHKEKFDAAFSKANEKANEIIEILDKTKDKFMDDKPIFNLINEFKEYLSSLSAMEICLIINITSCVFILTCIISIFFFCFFR